jgi:hypothetical protein
MAASPPPAVGSKARISDAPTLFDGDRDFGFAPAEAAGVALKVNPLGLREVVPPSILCGREGPHHELDLQRRPPKIRNHFARRET